MVTPYLLASYSQNLLLHHHQTRQVIQILFSLLHYSLLFLHYFRVIVVLSLIQVLKTSEGLSRPASIRSLNRAVNVIQATSDFCCGSYPFAAARSNNCFALSSSPLPKVTKILFLIISPNFSFRSHS